MATTPSELAQLKKLSTVVADTGDPSQIARLRPAEATTNPSLILAVSRDPRFENYIKLARHAPEPARLRIDRVLVSFGKAILQQIPGRVSTEVDARLSFDTRATVEKARRIISLYEAEGIDRERILIKIACTWEGTQAARVLELEGIHTNLTLIFCLEQAEAAAQANATLISPFVGRIYDWYKAKAGSSWDETANAGVNDPGVKSVARIYRRFKAVGCKTQIMAASFRNIEQILALAGCDFLTIAPKFIDQLADGHRRIMPMLAPSDQPPENGSIQISESAYRYALCVSEIANEKLNAGIRKFIADTEALEEQLH